MYQRGTFHSAAVQLSWNNLCNGAAGVKNKSRSQRAAGLVDINSVQNVQITASFAWNTGKYNFESRLEWIHFQRNRFNDHRDNRCVQAISKEMKTATKPGAHFEVRVKNEQRSMTFDIVSHDKRKTRPPQTRLHNVADGTRLNINYRGVVVTYFQLKQSAQTLSTKTQHKHSSPRLSTKTQHKDSTQRLSTKTQHNDSAQRLSIKTQHKRSGAKNQHKDSAQRLSTKTQHKNLAQKINLSMIAWAQQQTALGLIIRGVNLNSAISATNPSNYSSLLMCSIIRIPRCDWLWVNVFSRGCADIRDMKYSREQ